MRIPPAPLDGPDASTEAVARLNELRSGRIGNLYRSLLHSGPLAVGWAELGTAVRFRSSLDDRLRELIICQVVAMTQTVYEWNVHAPLALAAGVTQAQLDALPDWRDEPSFTDSDRAVLSLTTAVVAHTVTDQEMDAVKGHFSTSETVEITVTASYYVAVSRVLQAFGLAGDGPRSA